MDGKAAGWTVFDTRPIETEAPRERARRASEIALWQRPEPDTQHVLVDRTHLAFEGFAHYRRPVPVSNSYMIQRSSLGNLHVELPVNAGCGYSDPAHLVVCLDIDYRVPPTDALRVLAFAADPVRITAGSERAREAIRPLIEQAAPATPIELARDGHCTGECDRRITLESQ